MQKTEFTISKMDCPSEENLIRLKLADIVSVKNLEFDIPNRKLFVFHTEELETIENAIQALNLGAIKNGTSMTDQVHFGVEANQKRVLLIVLSINLLFFVIEMITGFISKSMGLVADSLDMLADSFVYGISLMAVGTTLFRKKQIAKMAGYFQIILAGVGLVEVLRRFLSVDIIPNFSTMIIVSMFALMANTMCLYVLQKSKNKDDAHMKASLIFTSNDVIINFGVIIAGVLVTWLNSNKPDLIIGIIVFVLVLQGAFRILKLSR